jgi:hypothetical protein
MSLNQQLKFNNSGQRRPGLLDLAQDIFPFCTPYAALRLVIAHRQKLVDRIRSARKRSTKFIQELPVDVKCTTKLSTIR